MIDDEFPIAPTPLFKHIYCMLCEAEIVNYSGLQELCPKGENWKQEPGPHRVDSQLKITALIGREQRKEPL